MFSKDAVNNLEKILISGKLTSEHGVFTGLNPWQREYIDHINGNTKSVLLAARRTGKTFTLAFLTCLILIEGKTAILALPNGRTVEGVILDEINKMLKVLERDVPILFTKLRDQTRDKTYSGGGRLLLLSVGGTNDGYGGSFVVIDEAQFMVKEDVLPVFEPFVAPFLAKNEGRIVLTGRGGPSKSLIHEASKLDANPYAQAIFNDDYLGSKYPWLKPQFDAAKGMPLYESHYGCKPIADSGNYLFPSISRHLPEEYRSHPRNRIFGIDTAGGVGRDYTVCALIETFNDYIIWRDHFEVNYGEAHEQCEGIHNFIEQYPRHRNSIMIEGNFNPMMYDELRRNYYPDIKMHKLGNKEKQRIVEMLMIANKDGRLIVENDKVRNELESLIFSVKPNKTWDFKDAHSDYLSALIMAAMLLPSMSFSM